MKKVYETKNVDGKLNYLVLKNDSDYALGVYNIEDADVDNFIDHMVKRNEIPQKITTRKDYEEICLIYSVTPKTDNNLCDREYAMINGNFYSDEYSKEKEKRSLGIAGIIDQRYFKFFLKEQLGSEKQEAKDVKLEKIKEKKINLTFVICDCCGIKVEKEFCMTASTGYACSVNCYDELSL